MSIESQALRGPISDIYSQLKGKIKTSRRPNEEAVYQKGLSILNVKTIWQTDRAVSLTNFYYPSKVLWDDSKIQINSLNDFPQREKAVIQGTAGQGKSIFLRYLAGVELNKGNKIPIFIELMKISEKNSLKQLIANALTEYGLNCRDDEVEAFLGTNHFILLLDAFDEVLGEFVRDTLSYVEHIASRFTALSIIVTSRPNCDIQNSAYFTVYDLAPLAQDDFRPILEKFYKKDTSEIYKILKFLEGESFQIVELITTPLLLTLLCITYNSTYKIPSSPYEFYQDLFNLLAERHDSTKPGFRRSFSSKLTINQLEKLFEAYSFFCMRTDSKTLSQRDAIQKVKDASLLCNVEPLSEISFLKDCVKNTCLLLKEGYEYQFIHKSVMEYHAASFINNADSTMKLKFYSAAVEKSGSYAEELKYLSYIDTENYERYFLKPYYNHVLNVVGFNGINCSIVSFLPSSCQVWFQTSSDSIRLRRLTRSYDITHDLIPRIDNDLNFCFIDAIQNFLDELIVINDNKVSIKHDDVEDLKSIKIVRDNQDGIELYTIELEDLQISRLKEILEVLVIKECIELQEKLDSLCQTIDLRDKTIESLEF